MWALRYDVWLLCSDLWVLVACIVDRSTAAALVMETVPVLIIRHLKLLMTMRKRALRRFFYTEPNMSSCCLCRWRCVWWLSWQPSARYPSTLSDTDICKWYKWHLEQWLCFLYFLHQTLTSVFRSFLTYMKTFVLQHCKNVTELELEIQQAY